MNQKFDNYDAPDRPQSARIGKRGFSLPNKPSFLPMPPVKPPKKEAETQSIGNDDESNGKKQLPDKGKPVS